MMNKLLSMKVFTTVVETGGFTSASNSLPISRAGVSKHIADLETSLGGRLLYRTTRRISVTQAGRAYYEKCKQILEAVDDADCLVSGLTSKPTGLLRMNAPMSFGNRWLGPLLAKFHEKFPDIKSDVTLTDRQVDIVEEGFDITIRINRPKDSSLVARRVAPCRFIVAAAPEYLNRFGIPTSPGDLANHQCLLYSYRPNFDKWKFSHPSGDIETRVTGPLVTNTGDLLCSAGISGMGIVLLPTFIISDPIRSGQLVPLLTDYSLGEAGIHVVYPSHRLLSDKVRKFSDFTVDYFNGRPQWDADLGLEVRA